MFYLILSVVVMLTGCGTFAEPSDTLTSAQRRISHEQLTLGADVFAANCASCHGETGRGDGISVQTGAVPYVPDFHNPATLTVNTPDEYYQVITRGRLEKFMPPWGSVLSESERRAAAAYAYRFRPQSREIAQVSPASIPRRERKVEPFLRADDRAFAVLVGLVGVGLMLSSAKKLILQLYYSRKSGNI
jgi:mono/diheme cytochrome c family protein